MVTDASTPLSRAALCSVERECQLEIRIFSARYQERIADISGASQQYLGIFSTISPGSLEVLEALANMEHRLGDDEKACLTYEDAITAGKQTGKTSMLPALLVQYAFFAFMVEPMKVPKTRLARCSLD